MERGNEDLAGHYKHPANGRPTGWHSLLCEENGSVLKCIVHLCPCIAGQCRKSKEQYALIHTLTTNCMVDRHSLRVLQIMEVRLSWRVAVDCKSIPSGE